MFLLGPKRCTLAGLKSGKPKDVVRVALAQLGLPALDDGTKSKCLRCAKACVAMERSGGHVGSKGSAQAKKAARERDLSARSKAARALEREREEEHARAPGLPQYNLGAAR